MRTQAKVRIILSRSAFFLNLVRIFFKIVRIYFKPGPHFFKQVRIILNHVCALKNADFSGLKKMRTFLV